MSGSKKATPRRTLRTRPRAPYMPSLEALEDRIVPTAPLWTSIRNPLGNVQGAMLLSDGTVMLEEGGDYASSTWFRLVPDATGSYINGKFSPLASMNLQRQFFTSDVLPSGKVFVLGGEFSGPGNTLNDINSGEIYDPVADSWTSIANFPLSQFGDDPSEVLPNGTILAGYMSSPQTYIYNPASNTWSQGGTKLRGDQSAEESWVKLPDDSILSYDLWASPSAGPGHAQRYIPATNTWVDAGSVPVPLSVATEIGPAVLLPNGNVFQIGANSNTAIYKPSTNTWVQGPSLPGGMGADDAPAAVLPNGHVLFAADSSSPTPYTGPTLLFDYDPSANTITQVPTPVFLTLALGQGAYLKRMLVLPNGDVLLTDSFSTMWEYTPDGSPSPSWQPTIAGVARNGGNTYTLTGTQLNGLSEGAYYGDDAEMASNFPIVRFTDEGGHVLYGRTFNWSSTEVATGSTPETVQFSLPAGLPPGNYSLTVTANGISSASAPYVLTSDGNLVSGATSFTVLTSTANPSTYGQSVTFTAAVAAGATPIASGTVTFEEGSTILAGNVPLDANGQASFSISTLPAAASPHLITALYNGSSQFPPSTGSTSLTVNQRAITVTADAESKTYGAADPPLTYQITAGALVSGDAFIGTLTRVPGETVLPHVPGVTSYPIQQGTLALSSNYALTYIGADLMIGQRAITIAADAQRKTYGAADPPLTFQITAGTLVSGDAFTGVLTRAPGENAGSYSIQQGTLSLGGNYALTFVGATLNINQRAIGVAADARSKTYGAADPAFTFQIATGSLAAGDGFTGTLSRMPGENVGSYAIQQGSLSLGSNYLLTFVGATLNINQRAITVAADAKSKTYGAADPTFTLQIASGSLAAGDAFTGTLSRVLGENVGSYAIQQGTLALNGNYALSLVGANLTISQRAVTITADAQSKPYGAADPPLTFQITAGTLVFGDAFAGALTRVPGENVGSYAIQQGTVALGANYALTYVGANLSVTPATQLVVTNLGSSSITAGSTVTITVTAEDSTGRTVPGYTGMVVLLSTDNRAMYGGGAVPASYTFVGNDAGSHTFTLILETAGIQSVTLTDQANANLTVTTNPITVTAVFTQFTVTVAGGTKIAAGDAFLFTVQATDRFANPVTDYHGPSAVAITATPADLLGSVPISGTLNSSGFGFFVASLKTAGSYTLTASADSFTGTSDSLTVTPAAASYFKVTVPATATTGSPVNVTVAALDKFGNTATSYGGLVHFTSSDAQAILPADTTLTGGRGVFSVTPNTAGNQTITATDTVSTNPKITGTSSPITTRGLTVTSLTPSPDGFTATFSKPFIPADLTLYGAGLNTVKDVTLIGTHVGAVPGSLIIDPAYMSVTLHATANGLSLLNDFGSAVLPDDTYTVTLLSGSGSSGFLDALGVGLDGTNSGGHANYRATFTTNYEAPDTQVLSIPDFSRGPDGGNSIKVPNDTGHGIPVTLYNAAGVMDVTFTLAYNPSLLSVSGGSSGDATDPASSFGMAGTPTMIDATHALASFHFSAAAAGSGSVVLGDIVAAVPDSAAGNYKAKELLGLGSVTVNHAAFAGVATSALHVNAYFGDVTGNGTIDVLDVARALTVAQGKSTGFAAFGLVDPAVVGDVELNYSVDAGDVSDLASFTVRPTVPAIPAIPVGLAITPVGPDPTLSLGAPSDVGRIGNPSGVGRISNPSYSEIVSVPVLLDDPRPAGSTGMTEAILALTYDPSLLSVSPSDITLGSIPSQGSGWQLTAMVDQARGQIGIVLYSTTAITVAEAGSLVNIAFHVKGGDARISPAATTVQLVSSVMLGGQEFVTQVDDAQGQFVLSCGIDRLLIHRARFGSMPARRAGEVPR